MFPARQKLRFLYLLLEVASLESDVPSSEEATLKERESKIGKE
jgi:hypothetical protein